MKDFKIVLKNKNFIYLWSSQILSQLTINVMNFLLLIKLFNETSSTIATSFLWVAYALPAILIGPVAAASVDMLDRKKVLLVTNLMQSILVLFYALLYRNGLFLLYGIAVGYSFLNQFYLPAESATLPSLVKKSTYPYANGLFFLTQQTALIIGFGIAGILNSLLGFDKSLFVCAIFLFLAFLSVSFLPSFKISEKIPKTIEGAVIKFFSRIFEGYKFIKEDKMVLSSFLLLMGIQISLSVVLVNIPVIAEQLIRINLSLAGLVMVVPAGIGAVIGAVIIPKLLKRKWRKIRIIKHSLFLISVCLFMLIFMIPELKLGLSILLSVPAIILIGFSFVGILIPSQTLLQERTPKKLRGRVFGNFWFLVTVASVFPVILSGAISEIFNIRLLLFILAGFCISVLVFLKNITNYVYGKERSNHA